MRGPQQFFRERVAAGGAGEGADKGAELGQTVVAAGRQGGAVAYAVDVDLAGAGGLAGLVPEAGGESGDRGSPPRRDRGPARHIGQVHELTGPSSVGLTEAAAEFSRVLGREVSHVDLAREGREEQLPKLGLSAHVVLHIITVAKLHRDNRYDRTTDGVERVTGVPARSIEAFVAARRDFCLG